MGPGARASDPSGSSNSSNQAARRETARIGQAIRQAGDPRVRDMALEPAPRRLVMNADRPIRPAACLTVVARPSERRRRSGAFGRRWERPPPSGCLDRHWGRSACARACHPPRRGRSRSIDPMREGRRVARACGNAARHPRSFGILDLKWHRNWHQVGDWRTTCVERLSKGLSTAGRGCSTLYRESTLRSTFHSSIIRA